MADSTKRRFIAGAVCPRCSSMDTLVIYRQEEQHYRECVNCGFHEVMHFKSQAKELPTRVTIPAEEKHVQTEVIKILPPEQQ